MTSQNYDIKKKNANITCHYVKKKHDIQKITDCIRSNSEKRDGENKQKICVQVFKPTCHEITVIFL